MPFEPKKVAKQIKGELDPSLWLEPDLFNSKLTEYDYLYFSKAWSDPDLQEAAGKITATTGNADPFNKKICAFLVYACTHRTYNGSTDLTELQSISNLLRMSLREKLQAAAAVDRNYFDSVFDSLLPESIGEIKAAVSAGNFALLRWAANNQQTYIVDKLLSTPQVFEIIAPYYFSAVDGDSIKFLSSYIENYVSTQLPDQLKKEIGVKPLNDVYQPNSLRLDLSRYPLLQTVIKINNQKIAESLESPLSAPELRLNIARAGLPDRNPVYAAARQAGNDCLMDLLKKKIPGISARWEISPPAYRHYMSIFEKAVTASTETDKRTIFLEAARYLLEDYTKNNSAVKRILFFHWRHHAISVKACLDEMEGDPYYTVDGLMAQLHPIRNKPGFNPMGSIAKRILFLEEQASIWGVVFDKKTDLHQVYVSSQPYAIKQPKDVKGVDGSYLNVGGLLA